MYWQNWISCRAQAPTCVLPLLFLLAPAKWAERWEGKLGFNRESHRCAVCDSCETMFNSEEKRRPGFPGSRVIGVTWHLATSPTAVNVSSTEWQQGYVQSSGPLSTLSSPASPVWCHIPEPSCYGNLNLNFFSSPHSLLPGEVCQNYSQLWHDLKFHTFILQNSSWRRLGPIT